MIEGILIGLSTALSLTNILMVMVGCFAGTIIGMLPGLGPMTAIALMIPITYGFDPSTGLILMAGVYYGAVFGGSTSSILLNAPGIPGTVATAFDGYPMAQQGKAGKALAIAAYSSFAGGTISAIFLLVAAPSLSKVSLAFRSPDYFALMILGLTAISAFSSKGQFLKAMMMVVLGLMLATVGQDSLSDITRFTFNNMNLTDGISFVLIVMATFAMSEALTIIFRGKDPNRAAKQISLTELGSIKVNKEETIKMAKTIPRSSILGFLIGVLPGAGETIATLLAYGMDLVKNELTTIEEVEREKSMAPWSLDKVRKLGGVVEHPSSSKLFKDLSVGVVDSYGGFIIEIDQYDFGHVAHKVSKLYIAGLDYKNLPPLPPFPPFPAILGNQILNASRVFPRLALSSINILILEGLIPKARVA